MASGFGGNHREIPVLQAAAYAMAGRAEGRRYFSSFDTQPNFLGSAKFTKMAPVPMKLVKLRGRWPA